MGELQRVDCSSFRPWPNIPRADHPLRFSSKSDTGQWHVEDGDIWLDQGHVLERNVQLPRERQYPILTGPEITPEAVRRAITKYGSALLRKALPKERVAFFADYIQNAFDRTSSLTAQHLAESANRGFLSNQHLIDLGQKAFGVEDVVGTPVLYSVASGLLGPDFWSGNSTARRSYSAASTTPDATGRINNNAGFHLDAQYQFADFTNYSMNYWAPLTRCGFRAPSLQMVLADSARAKQVTQFNSLKSRTGRDQFGRSLKFNAETIDPNIRIHFGADDIWIPEIEPGDVVVFDCWTIHATYATAQMSDPRLSVEIRLISKDKKAY